MTIRRILLASALLLLLPVVSAGQEKKPLDHDAYDVWNRIQNDVVSSDGSWLAYRLVPGDGDATMVVRSTENDRSVSIERGTALRFTRDARHLIARIAPMEAAVDEARESSDVDAPTDTLAIVDLSDLGVTKIPGVKSFDLPEDAGGWLAYLMEPVDEEDTGDESPSDEGDDSAETEEEAAPRTDDGTTLVVHDLRSSRDVRFEHVVDYDFADDGSALFYTASGEDGAADGVFRVVDGDRSTVLQGPGRYLGLVVSAEGTAAFLTDRDDRSADVQRFSLFVGDGAVTSPAASMGTAGVPAGWAPSHHDDITFSESGRRVFFGTAPAPEPVVEDDTPEDERVVVDIWNWKDPLLQPMQLVRADDELERTWQSMVDVQSGRVVQLATPEMPEVIVAGQGDGPTALGRSDLPYRQLASWDGTYRDLYVVDLGDGSSRMIGEKVRGFPTISPAGRYVVWFDGFERVWYSVDLESLDVVDLTSALEVPFHDVLDDHPDALRSYGSAGWTEGDEAFVVYDQFDVWAIDPTGARGPRNLTEGTGRANDIRFRVLDLDPDDPFVPTNEDVHLNAFHLYTKANGIYRDRFDGSREPTRLVMDDARFGAVRKASDADVVAFERSTFQDFPDVWVTDTDFDSPRKVTDANPQQDEYAWGTAEIVEWTSNDGVPLQGILYKPEDFDASQEYPMMVYFYERSSDGLHNYIVPAAGGSSINLSFYVSRGYLVFVPDIPYRIGYPGESAIDAVVPGVLEVVGQGFVDRENIGVQGHSWGGYQIAYMVTRTDIFAAAEAGAPVANMISAYGGIRWGTGMSRMFQYERTQSRIGGSLWETPLRYIENSPIFTADKINTPLLMMHNDEDTAVPWYQGIELFVALRRLGQPVWMLNYNGEPHGLRKEQNRKDWAVRMQQFFDHYLKDAPAPVWMDEGVPAILKGKTLGLERTKVISDDDGAGGRR